MMRDGNMARTSWTRKGVRCQIQDQSKPYANQRAIMCKHSFLVHYTLRQQLTNDSERNNRDGGERTYSSARKIAYSCLVVVGDGPCPLGVS